MQTELKLQQDCFLWAWNTQPQTQGRLFMIHNNPRNAIEGAKLKAAGLRKGIADFIFILADGKYIFIEMKEETHQSKFQKWFEKCINLLGGNYIVCYSLESFQQVINTILVQEKKEGKLFSLPIYPVNGKG